ncbi:hypothetical protein [Streptomyces formicae]|nr:hypothetical protein [Streptomyces formicae]
MSSAGGKRDDSRFNEGLGWQNEDMSGRRLVRAMPTALADQY